MHNKLHIFLDLDDTMIITNPEYKRVNKKIANIVQKAIGKDKISLEEIEKLRIQIDIQNIDKYGFNKKRFPCSWKEVFITLSNLYDIKTTRREINKVYNIAKSIFSIKIKTYKNVHKVLSKLKSKNYELNILTLGDIEVQQKRIRDAKIGRYFDNIYIVPQKDIETMKNIMGKRNPNNCIMVGNSLKSDIYPAISNNVFSIHIKRETWDYDNFEIDFNNPKYTFVTDISEIVDKIDNVHKNILKTQNKKVFTKEEKTYKEPSYINNKILKSFQTEVEAC